MTARAKSFCWVAGLNGPAPQIVFDDPRVGCEDLRILAEIKLDPEDMRSLTQLATAYPAPTLNEES